jgi:hypothetical protein
MYNVFPPGLIRPNIQPFLGCTYYAVSSSVFKLMRSRLWSQDARVSIMMSISGLDDDDELSVRLGDYIFRRRVQIGRGKDINTWSTKRRNSSTLRRMDVQTVDLVALKAQRLPAVRFLLFFVCLLLVD